MPLSATLDFDSKGRSLLTVTVNGVHTLKRLLAGRYARAIYALQLARDADVGAPVESRGVRRSAEVGLLYAKVPGSAGALKTIGVKSMVHEIRKILRSEPRSGETGQLLPPDQLIETRKGKEGGYVLSCDVIIRPAKKDTTE